MNFHQDPMQNTQNNQNSKPKVMNTFSTNDSKHDTDNDPDENFKNQRQKYLQERLNRRKQVKKIRQQQFGSSSSQSDQDAQKNIIKPTIKKENQKFDNQSTPIAKSTTQEEQFRLKHQAYIKQKLSRKKQIIAERKKQFGSSSSESEQQQAPTNKNQTIKISEKVQKVSQKSFSREQQHLHIKKISKVQQTISPTKRSLGSKNEQNSKQKKPMIVQQIIYAKGQNPSDCKKITVLIQSKKNLQWIEETLVIENKRIKFINQNLQFLVAYISKIKLFFTYVTKDYAKVKITHKNQDFFFAVSTSKMIEQVPEYFYVFGRIAQDKLTLIGFQPKKNEATIMPNYMNLKDAPQVLKKSAIIFGNILKKSQVLGNWQTRFVYITDREIGSSKKPSQKPSMVISCETITQIWTRFDVENSNMLNIKIMYSSNTKTQFGIPLSDFTDQRNWLYSFYKVIGVRK